MAIVHMKCPKCGGTMVYENNQFRCPYCNLMMLNIVDAKIDADVTVMSPDDFAKRIEESKKQFVVHINDDFKVFDVNTMVINKQLKDATAILALGNFDAVLSYLSNVPSNILSAERLKFLAEYRAKNEYELSFFDGYIDNDPHFKNIINLADEQTRATYKKIAEHCREQHDTKLRIEAEITEVNKLLNVQLYQEAIAYTKEMCKRYPQTALSWAYACEVKCTISRNYNGNLEFSMMEKCPDYSEEKLPAVLKDKIKKFSNSAISYDEKYEEHSMNLCSLAGSLWVTLLSFIAFIVISKFDSHDNDMYAFFMIFYIICLFAFISSIVFIVNSIKSAKVFLPFKKSYNNSANLVPTSIKSKYGAKNASKKMTGCTAALIIGLIVLAALIFVLIKYADNIF